MSPSPTIQPALKSALDVIAPQGVLIAFDDALAA